MFYSTKQILFGWTGFQSKHAAHAGVVWPVAYNFQYKKIQLITDQFLLKIFTDVEIIFKHSYTYA